MKKIDRTNSRFPEQLNSFELLVFFIAQTLFRKISGDRVSEQKE